MMRRLTRYFIEGLIFLGPTFVTIYLFYWVLSKVDGIYKFGIPGMGVLLTICLITVFGFFASNFLTRRLLAMLERAVVRLPFVKMIYTSIRDLINAFVGEKKRFNRPVAVKLVPGSEVMALGFITADDLSEYGIQDMVSVYMPQSYNFAGNLVLVPRAQVTPLSADSGDIMAFIVSGGVTMKQGEWGV